MECAAAIYKIRRSFPLRVYDYTHHTHNCPVQSNSADLAPHCTLWLIYKHTDAKKPMEKRVFFRGESGLSETLNDRADEFQVILERFGREKNTELFNPGYLLLFYYGHLLIDWLIDCFLLSLSGIVYWRRRRWPRRFSRLTADTQYTPAHFIRATQTHTRKEGRKWATKATAATSYLASQKNWQHSASAALWEWNGLDNVGWRGRGGGVFK